MAKKLNVYNLGNEGVDVVRSAIHVQDGSFRKLQNGVMDHISEFGAIRKRDGMARFNNQSLAGPGQGFIGLPLPDYNTIHRHFYTGYDDDGGVATGAWRTSNDGILWTTIPTGSAPVVPASISQYGAYGTSAVNPAQCPWVSLNNVMYYPGNDYTAGTTQPTLHAWNGSVDYTLTTIPQNPYATGGNVAPLAILSIIPYSPSQILISTYDENTRSRIFLCSVYTGQLTQIAPASDQSGSGKALAAALTVYQNRIWYASKNGSGGAASSAYYARPTDTTWTLDSNSTTDTAHGYAVGMVVFQGNLYVGYGADVGANSIIRKRATATGAWSTVFTANSGSPAALNYCGPLIVTQDGNTILAYNQGTGNTPSVIQILASTNGTSWSSVYDIAANIGSSYTISGNPVLDTNGDIYWSVISNAQLCQIFKRTAAGVFSVVDNSNFHGRGPMVKISF